MVVAGLARRTRGYSTRNGPPRAPSRYRSDLEVSIASSLAGWAPQDCRGDSPTDPRDGSREFSLGRAPRIHGELLKLGITVSQATVSRYMPRSPKDRRSQAWRTFVRNHAIAMVQSRNFDGHSLARDLLSQVRSQIARLHVSPFSICRCICCIGHRSVVLGCLVYGKSIPCCRSSPARLVFQNCNLGSQIQGAGAAIAAGSQSRSFDDRSNSRSTYSTQAETSRGLLINAHNWQTFVFYALKSEPRYCVFVKPPILPKYHPHPIATLGQPRIRRFVFDADMYAADILRNDSSRAASSSATA